MKIYKMIFALVLFLTLLLTGCGTGSNNAERVIASEKTLPFNFNEIAFQRETVPLFHFMVRKAVDQSEFEQNWDLYRFEGELPSVDFEGKDVLFIGFQESGTCPEELGDIEWSPDNTMRVPFIESDRPCTGDATPRTLVIEFDKEQSSEMENLVIVQSGIATNVPFEN